MEQLEQLGTLYSADWTKVWSRGAETSQTVQVSFSTIFAFW